MATYFSTIQPTFLCCDIISRLREDINCLCCDTKVLVQMQTSYENHLPQFESLIKEIDEKLEEIPSLRHAHLNGNDPNCNSHKISEFVDFIKLVWRLASQTIERNSRAHRFISSRGIPVTNYLEKLMILTDFIQKYYFADFIHPECAMLFLHLCKQLRLLLTPELMVRGDQIEGFLNYILSAIPTLVNLLTVINLFTCTPKYYNLSVLCGEIVDGEEFVEINDLFEDQSECDVISKYTKGLLTGELFGETPISDTTPVVESRINRFYELAMDLSRYLLKISCPDQTAQPQQNPASMRPGCLDPAFYEMLPPLVRKTVTPRTTSSRGRGRPRRHPRTKETVVSSGPYGFEVASNDLRPIRLPSLQLPFIPFDY